MTTRFDTKDDAIVTGLYCAGRKDLCIDNKGERRHLEDILKIPEIKIVDGDICQFDYIHEDTLMIEFSNSDGKICRIATSRFRNGFDLWCINPENRFAIRI